MLTIFRFFFSLKKSLASRLIILFYHPRLVCAKCGWNMSRFSGDNNGRKETKNSIRIAYEPLINSYTLQKTEKFQFVWKKNEIIIQLKVLRTGLMATWVPAPTHHLLHLITPALLITYFSFDLVFYHHIILKLSAI